MNPTHTAERLPRRRWLALIGPMLLALGMAMLVMTAGSAQNSNFKLDCAVEWNNGKYYVFRGDQYIAYDIEKDMAVPGYPLKIAAGPPTSTPP
jgi:hypothetical protein